MPRREIIHQLVNLQRRHALANLLLHQIQHSRIQHTRLADALNLLWCLNQFTLGHQMALVLKKQNLLVHLRQRLSALHVPVSRVFLQQSHFIYDLGCKGTTFFSEQHETNPI